jgi:hypothetical protein
MIILQCTYIYIISKCICIDKTTKFQTKSHFVFKLFTLLSQESHLLNFSAISLYVNARSFYSMTLIIFIICYLKIIITLTFSYQDFFLKISLNICHLKFLIIVLRNLVYIHTYICVYIYKYIHLAFIII